MKLETNGVMTLKNINLLNNDFLGKITTLEQEVNVIQQTLGTATQDIGENSANGDFAFSAESGTVWMYDQNWYNSGDIVPDQVTPASDAIPLVDSGIGVAGTSTEYSRGDHKYPLQVSDVLPSKDTSVGTVGQASSYARSDQQHPIQTVDTFPFSDSADGSYGTVDSYARSDHSHPINVQTNALIVLIVNGVGNNAGGLATEVLCSNGDTTTDFVTKTTDQTITGRKTFVGTTLGSIQLNPTDVPYGEGIRIANSPSFNVNAIYIGTSTSSLGEIDGQWTIIKRNAGELYIYVEQLTKILIIEGQ
ncbi:MAG: hypothetical protein EZS28_037802 [Streblomastix strix]|uniref:Uncharacterized protein n=1 Tax=Streblomastix strix TaxID=222440 RepID=A0A5J4U9U7_9EUKA|nr:MAG: hypothetical protein EZS28_037802 [Streblomastix strix]